MCSWGDKTHYDHSIIETNNNHKKLCVVSWVWVCHVIQVCVCEWGNASMQVQVRVPEPVCDININIDISLYCQLWFSLLCAVRLLFRQPNSSGRIGFVLFFKRVSFTLAKRWIRAQKCPVFRALWESEDGCLTPGSDRVAYVRNALWGCPRRAAHAVPGSEESRWRRAGIVWRLFMLSSLEVLCSALMV